MTIIEFQNRVNITVTPEEYEHIEAAYMMCDLTNTLSAVSGNATTGRSSHAGKRKPPPPKKCANSNSTSKGFSNTSTAQSIRRAVGIRH